ncbi:DNA translocase FtsK [Lachnospiraceae bacterium OttesenSCG-928-D06]|nr:DNA translocase FtsK [Lachnospiraceae bacterium OttesenSCG-928-D06]
MAATSSRKTSSSKKSNRNSNKSSGNRNQSYQAKQDSELFHEIGLIVIFIVMVILFLCNFGVIGPVGNSISDFLFGLFGFTAYGAPVVIFFAISFWFANAGNPNAVRKLIAGTVLFVMVGVVCDLFANNGTILEAYDIKAIYEKCKMGKSGGGIIAGSLSFVLHKYLELLGTILVVILCSAISIILLTEKSLLKGIQNKGNKLRERSKQEAIARRAYNEELRQEQRESRKKREEEKRLKAEEKENEKILRMEKRVSGVILDTSLKRPNDDKIRDDIHEITVENMLEADIEAQVEEDNIREQTPVLDFEKIRIRTAHPVTINQEITETYKEEPVEEMSLYEHENITIHKEDSKTDEEIDSIVEDYETVSNNDTLENNENIGINEDRKANESIKTTERNGLNQNTGLNTAGKKSEADKGGGIDINKDVKKSALSVPKKYIFPPISRLQKGNNSLGDTTAELKETAVRLQQTLNTFGVKVTITDISQGPSVTRYELQPEQGVKVSKIVNLADDIKLNLAATDIRIEAPIPGKAAVGIEVPNKENIPVAFRDLIETKTFKDYPSNLAFAVGKDISGQVVVSDIAKMPHMLIAGATGSGKSVCINTLIMSILYKAHPDDVKLIMIDPKVVELSVYNGIPHLLIPVVTDPKKASAALHWGVSEMMDRYSRFTDYNVRDLKGYNKKVEALQKEGAEGAPAKMPQIVIIVDELADLMMVSPGEVEEAICRLAQLARAAGIHLIIATQRPSVDVITGLIKANMPSRVAFSVSSGVDSRTILDMNGAEKLLGKGDMLFYPQGYAKPGRIQGAFVSDKEVSDVVDFLKNQAIGNTYAEEIEEQIKAMGSGTGSASSGGGNERDEYFAEAGRFVIEKDKASIGMLQRVFKIGFNRAARVMDQLCAYGVVGEEEGTKPRKVLMSEEQFELLLEEI